MLKLKTNKTLKTILIVIVTLCMGILLAVLLKYYKNQDISYAQKLIEIIDMDEESKLSEKDLENYEIEINKELNILLKENTDYFKIKQSYYSIGAIKYLQNKNIESIKYLNKALEYNSISDEHKKETVSLDVKIYSALSSNYIIRNNKNMSDKFFEHAKTIALKNNRKELLCELYYGRAKSKVSAGYNINEAINLIRKSLEYTEIDSHKIRNYIYMSSLYKLTGDFDLALEYTINALEIAYKLDENILISKSIISLGEIYYTQKNYSKTIYIYENYFETHKLLDIENTLSVYGYLTECYAKEGDYVKYKTYRDKYIDLASQQNDVKRLVWIYSVCADIELANSNLEDAKKYLIKSQTLYEENKDKDILYTNSKIMIQFLEAKINYKETKNYIKTLEIYNNLLEDLKYRGIKSDISSIIVDEILSISIENNDFKTFKEYINEVDDYSEKESSQTYIDSIYTSLNNTFKEKSLIKEKIKKFILLILCIVSMYELKNSKSKNKKIEKLNLKLRSMSILDPLTSLYNRAYLAEKLKESIENNEAITFIMIDIDYFKLYNDNYGHINGDEVLIKVSNLIKNTFKDDIVFRYGGEEFSIISNKTIAESIKNIEVLKVKLNNENIIHEYSKVSDRITLSIGLSSRKICSENDIIEITKASDINLYRSKNNGRNRYTF